MRVLVTGPTGNVGPVVLLELLAAGADVRAATHSGGTTVLGAVAVRFDFLDASTWSGVGWTFVRASFFHQNLSTTHLTDVRDRSTLMVLAGNGTTAFVDTKDVGEVAAAALLDPAAHRDRAWTVTGGRALTYTQVADTLTLELGRTVGARARRALMREANWSL